MARTDDAGRAVLYLQDRQHTVVVRRIGFSERLVQIRLRENQRQQLRVSLAPIRTLATVQVTASAPLPNVIERRRRLARGWVYGPDEVAAVHSTRELLARTPGARLQGVGRWSVSFRHPDGARDCWADVYIDGQLSAPEVSGFGGGPIKFDELQSLPASAIYAVEVYPRVSHAPQNVVRLREGCGVILVWTKTWADLELARDETKGRTAAPALADSAKRE